MIYLRCYFQPGPHQTDARELLRTQGGKICQFFAHAFGENEDALSTAMFTTSIGKQDHTMSFNTAELNFIVEVALSGARGDADQLRDNLMLTCEGLLYIPFTLRLIGVDTNHPFAWHTPRGEE